MIGEALLTLTMELADASKPGAQAGDAYSMADEEFRPDPIDEGAVLARRRPLSSAYVPVGGASKRGWRNHVIFHSL